MKPNVLKASMVINVSRNVHVTMMDPVIRKVENVIVLEVGRENSVMNLAKVDIMEQVVHKNAKEAVLVKHVLKIKVKHCIKIQIINLRSKMPPCNWLL